MYDVNFVLPVTAAEPKYETRLKDMKTYGILNVPKDKKVNVTLLADKTVKSHEAMYGWLPEVDVRFLVAPYTNVQHKFAWYYINHEGSSPEALWTARIDDDSATDVGGLLHRLRHVSPKDQHHFVAEQCGDVHNLQPEYEPIIAPFGFTPEEVAHWIHSWEISVDSMATMDRLHHSAAAGALYRRVLDLPQDKVWWTDQIYCYALRLLGVWPTLANFLSMGPNNRNFSYTGGRYTHIHYIARDLDARGEFVPKDGVWSAFKEAVDMKLRERS